ncbi:unnamed protein product [Cuscuta campestris]|uniref:Uncharacterized protein n=1 Tax=Cuscuta campestris TaxID=132261 RepID=A0A484N7J0_9ASTE|nr:unnamed protein product [Cuscuta campestris]
MGFEHVFLLCPDDLHREHDCRFACSPFHGILRFFGLLGGHLEQDGGRHRVSATSSDSVYMDVRCIRYAYSASTLSV